jgi:hypothetical protein
MSAHIDLSNITAEQRAQIIREERDVLMMAWLANKIQDLTGAEKLMNNRVMDLGFATITGDTTD